jgi:hypothetical protein
MSIRLPLDAQNFGGGKEGGENGHATTLLFLKIWLSNWFHVLLLGPNNSSLRQTVVYNINVNIFFIYIQYLSHAKKKNVLFEET